MLGAFFGQKAGQLQRGIGLRHVQPGAPLFARPGAQGAKTSAPSSEYNIYKHLEAPKRVTRGDGAVPLAASS